MTGVPEQLRETPLNVPNYVDMLVGMGFKMVAVQP